MMSYAYLTYDMRSNFRHLYADMFWFGVLSGSTLAFLSVYATRQGASSLQISLLTAGPAVMNLLFSLPAGWWLERRSPIRASFRASLWQRVGYLLLIPLPWLFTPALEIWAIVLITLFMSIPATLLAVSFNAMFADVVPARWLGQVVSRRNALLALSLSMTSLICGQLLDRIGSPLDYQIVFGIGAAGALVSTYHLSRIRALFGAQGLMGGGPAEDRPASTMPKLLAGMHRVQGLRFFLPPSGVRPLRLDLLRGPFGRFMAAYLLFYMFQYLPLPLFPVFNVRTLLLTDGEISLGSALFYLVMMLVSLLFGTGRLRLSYRSQLVSGGLLYGLFPLVMYLAQDARLYWLAMLQGGFVSALLNAGLINRLMERVPIDDRPAHMTLHNLALNLGILAGALAGPVLAGLFGLREMMLISFGLRVVAGVILVLWG